MDMGRFRIPFGALLVACSVQAQAETIPLYNIGSRDIIFPFSVVEVPFVASPFNDKITVKIPFAPQSSVLDLSEDILGNGYRIDSIQFFAQPGFNYRIVQDFFVDAVDELNGNWEVRGSYAFSGTLNILANGSNIGSSAFSYRINGGCGGTAPQICILEDQTVITDFDKSPIANLLGPDLPKLEILYSDVMLVGKLNDDRGEFGGGEYSGEFTLWGPLIGELQYSEVSQVPLPGAVWLFLSAVIGLASLSVRWRG